MLNDERTDGFKSEHARDTESFAIFLAIDRKPGRAKRSALAGAIKAAFRSTFPLLPANRRAAVNGAIDRSVIIT